jgi:uncharacterized protein
VTDIQFEWDQEKNRSNKRKHGVSFEVAREVFRDPLRVSIIDRVVEGEERWQTCGMVKDVLLLVVAHTNWEDIEDDNPVECVRIISARKVTRSERETYEQNR